MLPIVLRKLRTFGIKTGTRRCHMLPQNALNVLMENVCPNSCGWTSRTKRPLTIAVEGNIGSGKTTFLRNFEHLKNSTIIPEPVARWCSVDGRFNLLQKMYENPRKYSLALQTYVQLTMLQNHRAPVSTDFKLMERSLYSARYCFVENLFRSNLLSEVETIILDEWFEHLITTECCVVDLIVYLRTDPAVAMDRIKKRNRDGENTVSMDYLNSLHDLHEEWFAGRSSFPMPANCVVLDANQDADLVKRDFIEYVKNHDFGGGNCFAERHQ
ncbi:deoxynucleoside kinase [Galendromus occidentalis]|uniref:Deoxynucleoside kinase n=1 Tax=Galendromus occidentalis TaxID=34638 RepID=A0AAJ6QVX1_9ACAR|nr:deoxynucleoside kinase [Galendromus occidentalis]